MKIFFPIFLLTITSILFFACSGSKGTIDTTQISTPLNINFHATHSLHNSASYVTSQCYTKTEDENGGIHNPCFSCHINSEEPNFIDDWALQESYDVSDYTKTNRFSNLFKDRTQDVEKISDDEIVNYINQNNYMQNGKLLLAEKLNNLPTQWDINNDGKWNGYTPDCYFNFDDEGFDSNLNGEFTGWRAFAYYPFLGTFWPTNGSTDDVLIRLPIELRQNNNSEFDKNIYKINLAIVESLIKKTDIAIDKVDENLYGVDLNQNGTLDLSSLIKYNWVQPYYDITTQKLSNFSMSYVGKSKDMLISNDILMAPGLYPKGTEFLHTVRYIDTKNNTISLAPRMKELRYGVKTHWNTYSQLQTTSSAEIKERDAFPDRLRNILGNSENGLQNALGWTFQGFIEDRNGELRPQNYEETQYCIGCHSGTGVIADSTFVFQRKFNNNAFQKGWYHWSQDSQGLKNIKEPLTKNGLYEYSLYLEKNHAGDEFRANNEVIENFFNEDKSLKADKIDTLHSDISTLLYPSIARALNLNKAYKVIVNEQSFIYGRDTHIKPVQNVHKSVQIGQKTKVTALRF